MPKYYDENCLKILFYSLHFQWWYKFLEKVLILARKCWFVQKTTNQQYWKFSKCKVWPKPRIQNSTNTKPLNLELLLELTCFILKSWLDNVLKLQKISKNSSLKETGPSCGLRFVSPDNPSQNIWHKLKKYSKIRQGFKNVISNFAGFLTATVNVWFVEGRLSAGLLLHPLLTFF